MLCAVCVDLDEIRHYYSIHGLVPAEGRGNQAVYEVALERLEAFARAHHLPLTCFVVGRDLEIPQNAERVRSLAEKGHEIGNHSLDHRYDLVELPQAEQRRQVEQTSLLIEAVTGQRPRGFRAPGYAVSDQLLAVLESCGLEYDSSVFPCPVYYLGKALVLGSIRLRGRRSQARLDRSAVLRAPIRPYRVGLPYWRRGRGLIEVPVQVTRRLRLPYLGTALTVGGPRGARWLTRDVVGERFINLSLHGIDLLDSSDGLEALAAHQLDLRVPVERKLETLSVAIETLRRSGYRFVKLSEVVEQLPL